MIHVVWSLRVWSEKVITVQGHRRCH